MRTGTWRRYCEQGRARCPRHRPRRSPQGHCRSGRERGLRRHRRCPSEGRSRHHRGIRDVLRPLARRASGSQPADGREHRHRRLPRASVQGRKDTPRYRQSARISRLSGPRGRLGNSSAVRFADADRALSASVRQAKSFATVEPRSLSIRLRLTTPSQRSRRPEPSSNPIDRPGYRTPPRPVSLRVNTFGAGG